MRVWRAHLSCRIPSQPVLISPRNSYADKVRTRVWRENSSIIYTLDLFSSRLKALGDISVNQSRVKGNENVLNALPCCRRFLHESVNVYICAYFVSFTSCQKSRRVPETRMWTRLQKNVGKLYPSQRTRMSRFVINATSFTFSWNPSLFMTEKYTYHVW